MTTAPSNRERVLAAAVELLGTRGLRALTHGRVDDAAGLPRGSTSNVFRTRSALLQGAVEAIVAAELPAVGAGLAPETEEELVESLAGLLDVITGPGRTTTTARLVLFLEGAHNAALRDALSQARGTLLELTRVQLARLGAPDPATAALALTSCFEGLILHRVARHDDTDSRPILATVVRGALHG